MRVLLWTFSMRRHTPIPLFRVVTVCSCVRVDLFFFFFFRSSRSPASSTALWPTARRLRSRTTTPAAASPTRWPAYLTCAPKTSSVFSTTTCRTCSWCPTSRLSPNLSSLLPSGSTRRFKVPRHKVYERVSFSLSKGQEGTLELAVCFLFASAQNQ